MTTPKKDQAPSPLESSSGGKSVQLRAIPSEQLFKGAKAVVITHAGEQYRLLATKNGKLILQK